MTDHYITIGELLALLAVFVGPFLLAGALGQFLILQREGIRWWVSAVIVLGGAVITIVLMYALTWVISPPSAFHWVFGYGASLILPGLLSAGFVTLCVFAFSRLRARKAA